MSLQANGVSALKAHFLSFFFRPMGDHSPRPLCYATACENRSGKSGKIVVEAEAL